MTTFSMCKKFQFIIINAHQLSCFFQFFPDFAYGHPGGFNPFMLNPGWLDAAYMNYAWTDYFRHQHQPHHPALAKGK